MFPKPHIINIFHEQNIIPTPVENYIFFMMKYFPIFSFLSQEAKQL